MTLDGATHTVQRPMEGVAMRMGPGSRYRLKIVAETTDYGVDRALGTVQIERAGITLPAGDAAATKAAGFTTPAPRATASASRLPAGRRRAAR